MELKGLGSLKLLFDCCSIVVRLLFDKNGRTMGQQWDNNGTSMGQQQELPLLKSRGYGRLPLRFEGGTK